MTLRRAAAAGAGLAETALLGVTAYVGLLTAAAWRARQRGAGVTPLPAVPTRRFLVLIPAHNEAPVIGAALASLQALDYPADLVGVHVVADNCTDATAEIVRTHGFEAHERVAPDDGGKGPALRWLLARLRDRGERHDAVVIIDADTSTSPNFLRVMDAKLAVGATVVQSYYAVRDAEQSSTAAFRQAALAVRHYLRPLGRTELGGSSGLHGNGMAFTADLLAAHDWSSHLVEDIELQLDLLLEGTLVAFAPDVSVAAEMPTTVEASRTQHERWERGRMEMTTRYVPRLVRAAVANTDGRRVAYADAAVDQLLPPFSVTVAATAGWAAFAALATLATGGRHRRRLVMAGGMVAVQSAYVVSGLQMVAAPPAVYRALATAPRLVMWKIGLWLRMLVRPGREGWVRTARNVERAP